jgi:hypothetical protein
MVQDRSIVPCLRLTKGLIFSWISSNILRRSILTRQVLKQKFELSVSESDNLTHDFYEYEQGQANIIAKLSLRNHFSFWKSIGCYDYILDTINSIAMRISLKLILVFQRCLLTCLRSKIKHFFLPLDAETVSGLTTYG